jgi:hypothetical protein
MQANTTDMIFYGGAVERGVYVLNYDSSEWEFVADNNPAPYVDDVWNYNFNSSTWSYVGEGK